MDRAVRVDLYGHAAAAVAPALRGCAEVADAGTPLLLRGARGHRCELGRARSSAAHSALVLRSELLAHGGRDPRHDHQSVPVLLAGGPGGRGYQGRSAARAAAARTRPG